MKLKYPRDEAYREGVLLAMQALDSGDEPQCWYWLLMVSPFRPEWLQAARLYYAIFGDQHSRSATAWKCLFFSVWSGELGPLPADFAAIAAQKGGT